MSESAKANTRHSDLAVLYRSPEKMVKACVTEDGLKLNGQNASVAMVQEALSTILSCEARSIEKYPGENWRAIHYYDDVGVVALEDLSKKLIISIMFPFHCPDAVHGPQTPFAGEITVGGFQMHERLTPGATNIPERLGFVSEIGPSYRSTLNGVYICITYQRRKNLHRKRSGSPRLVELSADLITPRGEHD